jgi:Protein related to penicillin acylase
MDAGRLTNRAREPSWLRPSQCYLCFKPQIPAAALGACNSCNVQAIIDRSEWGRTTGDKMKSSSWKRPLLAAGLSIAMGASLVGCNSSSSSDGDVETGNNNNDLPALSERQINAPDGKLSARIQTTTGGVPHITADNLESAGFGSGYVQARDNICIIADSIIRARGERAMYYGPGPEVAPTLPIGVNIVTDFSYKALGLLDKANAEFDQLSAPSQAMRAASRPATTSTSTRPRRRIYRPSATKRPG